MRHRIVSGTGFGNPEPALLTNTGNVDKEFAEAAIKAYFEDWEGFDYDVTDDVVKVGIEPAYQYDKLKILEIHRDKSKSSIRHGKAWGAYGSKLVSTVKTYGEYKRRNKFVKFVDEWHGRLFK
jgi:hypothetical protein